MASLDGQDEGQDSNVTKLAQTKLAPLEDQQLQIEDVMRTPKGEN